MRVLEATDVDGKASCIGYGDSVDYVRAWSVVIDGPRTGVEGHLWDGS